MAKYVALTPIAINDLENIIEYLTFKWGITVALDLMDRFEEVITLLENNPKIFPYFDRNKQIQKCVITKHNILYFKETEQAIHVLTIFDTRQDPDKLTILF